MQVEDDPYRHTYAREGLHLYRVKRKPMKPNGEILHPVKQRSNNKQKTA